MTAYQAEKYRCHHVEDPLYILAHTVPPTRLKRRTWQHYSHDILEKIGIDSSRSSCPDIQSNRPLQNQILPHETTTGSHHAQATRLVARRAV